MATIGGADYRVNLGLPVLGGLELRVVFIGYMPSDRGATSRVRPSTIVIVVQIKGDLILVLRSDTQGSRVRPRAQKPACLGRRLCGRGGGVGDDGIGGMAGVPLHPLALGNVRTLRRLLDAHPATRHVVVVGVGGVDGPAAYRRMRGVGAAFVGVGTVLGRKGVDVFREIGEGLGGVR